MLGQMLRKSRQVCVFIIWIACLSSFRARHNDRDVREVNYLGQTVKQIIRSAAEKYVAKLDAK